MHPLYGSFSHPSTHHVQSAATSAQPPQKLAASKPLNSCNMLQNSMLPLPHLSTDNPQIPIPFGNSNGYLNNAMTAQPGFIGAPNDLLPLQNNHLGLPHLGSTGPIPQMGKPYVGLGQQNCVNNMNLAFPTCGQFCNFGQNVNQVTSSQFPGQPFAPTVLKLLWNIIIKS